MSKVILDTNILMSIRDEKQLLERFKEDEIIVILGTLQELDRLKMSDGKRGFEARNGLRFLRNHADLSTVLRDKEDPLDDSVDSRIIQTANDIGATVITNDLSMSSISSAIGVNTEQFYEVRDDYRDGTFELEIGEELHNGDNIYMHLGLFQVENDVRINEYIIVKEFGIVTGVYRWESNGFREIGNPIIDSKVMFGKIGAIKNDPYQMCAIDALSHNQINLITGPAGSGKSFLTLAAQWAMIERGEIDGITIFVNPVKSRNSKEVGYYKGSKDDKLLQEGIGSILASKLGGGDIKQIEGLMLEGKIKILPVSDIRGYEVTDNRSLYITEAQNLDVELMKLAIQRAEDCKVFIEGDPGTQLDGWMYEGSNNGMKRAIEVFSGEDCFGTVKLKNIYRSKIAAIADRM